MSVGANVTIVTVSYNSAAVLGNMLASAPPQTPKIVVDNCSTDNSLDVARTNGAKTIALDQNIGFGAASNRGALQAATEYLFFVNPDAVLEPDCIDELCKTFRKNPEASALNPTIIKPNGKFEFKYYSVLLPRRRWISRKIPDTDMQVPILSGGALFCRREDFLRIDGFDENIFLFFEDDDISRRFEVSIGPLMVSRKACVRHLSGGSSGREQTTIAFKAFHSGRSRAYVLKKYGWPLPVIGTIIRSVVSLLMPNNLLQQSRRLKYVGAIKGSVSLWQDSPKPFQPAAGFNPIHSEMAPPDVTIISVAYNSANALPDMLASIPTNVRTIVVDNNSSDKSQRAVESSRAEWVQMGENLGFSAACNKGASMATSRYLLFLNPDSRLTPNCLEVLCRAAQKHTNAGGFSPYIRKPSGKAKYLYSSFLVPRRFWNWRTVPTHDSPITMLLGGALFCRRQDFEAVGGFDANIFLFCEDDDLSLRLHQKIGPLMYIPGAVIDHIGGSSSEDSIGMDLFKAYQRGRSRAYLFAKYGWRFPIARTALRAGLSLLWPSNFIPRRRRAKYVGTIKGALSMWGKIGNA